MTEFLIGAAVGLVMLLLGLCIGSHWRDPLADTPGGERASRWTCLCADCGTPVCWGGPHLRQPPCRCCGWRPAWRDLERLDTAQAQH